MSQGCVRASGVIIIHWFNTILKVIPFIASVLLDPKSFAAEKVIKVVEMSTVIKDSYHFQFLIVVEFVVLGEWFLAQFKMIQLVLQVDRHVEHLVRPPFTERGSFIFYADVDTCWNISNVPSHQCSSFLLCLIVFLLCHKT